MLLIGTKLACKFLLPLTKGSPHSKPGFLQKMIQAKTKSVIPSLP